LARNGHAEGTRATERMPAAAEFQMKTADTPEQLAHLQTLTPDKILQRERSGETAGVKEESSDPRSWGLWLLP
jgi:hypothetical protein